MKKYYLMLVLLTFVSACTQNREATPKADDTKPDLEVTIDNATFSSGGLDISEASLTVAGELNFGIINNNSAAASVDRVLRIKNTTASAVTLSASLPSIPAPFSIKYNRCPSSLDAGASCYIAIRAFARNMPDSTSSVTKQLTLMAGSNQIDVDLTALSISGGGTVNYTGTWTLADIGSEWSYSYEDAFYPNWNASPLGSRPALGGDFYLSINLYNNSSQLIPAGAVTASIDYPYILRSNRCGGKDIKPGELCSITVMYIGWRDLDILPDGLLRVKMSETDAVASSISLSASHFSPNVEMSAVFVHPKTYSSISVCGNISPQIYDDQSYSATTVVEGADSHLYFAGCNDDVSGTELMKLNVTTGELSLVADIDQTAAGFSSGPTSMARIGNKIYMTAITEWVDYVLYGQSYPDYELVVYDTSTNTTSVIDLTADGDPTLGNNYYTNPTNTVSFNGKLYFSYTDLPGHGSTGDLYEFNTTTNTISSVIHDFNTAGDDGVSQAKVIHGNLYLFANNSSGTRSLFRISPSLTVTDLTASTPISNSVDNKIRVSNDNSVAFRATEYPSGINKYYLYDSTTSTTSEYSSTIIANLDSCGSNDYDFFGTTNDLMAIGHNGTQCQIARVHSDLTTISHNAWGTLSSATFGYFGQTTTGKIIVPFHSYQESGHAVPGGIVNFSGYITFDSNTSNGFTILEKNNMSSPLGNNHELSPGFKHSDGSYYFRNINIFRPFDPVFTGGYDIYKIK